MKRTLISKVVGAAAVVALATALLPTIGHAGTDVNADQTIRVPGGIGAFYVGPLTATVNGQQQTLVPKSGADGVKNLAITLRASRGGEINETLDVGKASDCAPDAMLNALANVGLSGSSAAAGQIFVEYDRQLSNGTLEHKWVDSTGTARSTQAEFFSFSNSTPEQSGGISLPICVNGPLS